MPPAPVRIHQDLIVVDVRPSGAGVEVAVLTPTGRRERICFHAMGETELFERVDQLRAWMHRGTPVTYVMSGGSGALIDELAWFEAAFEAPDLL